MELKRAKEVLDEEKEYFEAFERVQELSVQAENFEFPVLSRDDGKLIRVLLNKLVLLRVTSQC